MGFRLRREAGNGRSRGAALRPRIYSSRSCASTASRRVGLYVWTARRRNSCCSAATQTSCIGRLAEDLSYSDAVVEATDQGVPQGRIGAQIPRTEPTFTDRTEELMIVRGHPAQAGDKLEGRVE